MTQENKASLIPVVTSGERFFRLKQLWYRYFKYYKLQWSWVMLFTFIAAASYTRNYIPLALPNVEIPKQTIPIESFSKDVYIRAEIPRYVTESREVSFTFFIEQLEEPNAQEQATVFVDASGAGIPESSSADYVLAEESARPWETKVDIDYDMPDSLYERKVGFNLNIKLSGYSDIKIRCADGHSQFCIRVIKAPRYLLPLVSALNAIGFFSFAIVLVKEYMSRRDENQP